MHALLSAALTVAALAPWLEARAWGVPLRWVSLGRMARTFVSAGVVTGLTGGFAWLLLQQAGKDPRVTALSAGAVAFVFGLLLAWSSARRERTLRGLHVLTTQLGTPARREAAAAHIEARLTAVRAEDPRQYALLALFAAGPLTRHALGAAARRHLDAVDPARLAPTELALAAQLRAMSHLQEGAVEAADAALGTAPYPTSPAVDAWIDLTRALAQVVCGGDVRALLDVRQQDAARDPALALLHDTVAAHALSAAGDDDAARARLTALLERSGAGALAMAIRPVGPATDLARAVVATHIGSKLS